MSVKCREFSLGLNCPSFVQVNMEPGAVLFPVVLFGMVVMISSEVTITVQDPDSRDSYISIKLNDEQWQTMSSHLCDATKSKIIVYYANEATIEFGTGTLKNNDTGNGYTYFTCQTQNTVLTINGVNATGTIYCERTVPDSDSSTTAPNLQTFDFMNNTECANFTGIIWAHENESITFDPQTTETPVTTPEMTELPNTTNSSASMSSENQAGNTTITEGPSTTLTKTTTVASTATQPATSNGNTPVITSAMATATETSPTSETTSYVESNTSTGVMSPNPSHSQNTETSTPTPSTMENTTNKTVNEDDSDGDNTSYDITIILSTVIPFLIIFLIIIIGFICIRISRKRKTPREQIANSTNEHEHRNGAYENPYNLYDSNPTAKPSHSAPSNTYTPVIPKKLRNSGAAKSSKATNNTKKNTTDSKSLIIDPYDSTDLIGDFGYSKDIPRPEVDEPDVYSKLGQRSRTIDNPYNALPQEVEPNDRFYFSENSLRGNADGQRRDIELTKYDTPDYIYAAVNKPKRN